MPWAFTRPFTVLVGYRGVQQRLAWSTDFYLKTNNTQSYNSQCLAIRDIFAHILHVLQYTTHGNLVETRNERAENTWGLGWIQKQKAAIFYPTVHFVLSIKKPRLLFGKRVPSAFCLFIFETFDFGNSLFFPRLLALFGTIQIK